ncbi:hypothetical protein Plhal304r1_c022g0077751 [Plasmopara halstedii]
MERHHLSHVAIVAVFILMTFQASSYEMFKLKVPNGGNVPGANAIGHDRVGGGPKNDFGLDFSEAMFIWTNSFCNKDSDGDGQTNGQELGDPCCEFVFRKNAIVRWTEGVSHPGDATLMSDPKLWEGIVCETQTNKSTVVTLTNTIDSEHKSTKAGAVEEEIAEPEAAKKHVESVQDDIHVQTKDLTAGVPTMHRSVILSVVMLTVMAIYFLVTRAGRRSRNLPIFRRQRKGHI